MRARTSNVIGGLGWRLPWFLFPICAADLPAGNARPRERRDGSTTQPRFPLSGQSELAFAKLGYDLLCTHWKEEEGKSFIKTQTFVITPRSNKSVRTRDVSTHELMLKQQGTLLAGK